MATNRDKVYDGAMKLLAQGKYDKGVAELQKVLADDPNDARTLLKIAETLHVKLGKKKEALDHYHKAASIYSEQGFFLKAVAVFKQMLQVDAQSADMHLKLAELYQQLGYHSNCVQHYGQVVVLYEQQGRSKDTLAILKRMVDLEPDNLASRIKLAELFAQHGMAVEAATEMRQALTFLQGQGRLDDAVRVGEKVLVWDPNAFDVARELANIYLGRGEWKLALAKLQMCFRVDPRNLEVLEQIGQAFLSLDQTLKSVSVYKEMARIHESQGQVSEARARWQKVLELSPGDDDAEAALGMRGSPAPSQPAVAPASPAAARAHPEDEQVQRLLTETEVYVKYGLRDKAIEHLDRIFSIRPDHIAALEKLKTLQQQQKMSGLTDTLRRLVDKAEGTGHPKLDEWKSELARAPVSGVVARAAIRPSLASERPASERPAPVSAAEELIFIDDDVRSTGAPPRAPTPMPVRAPVAHATAIAAQASGYMVSAHEPPLLELDDEPLGDELLLPEGPTQATSGGLPPDEHLGGSDDFLAEALDAAAIANDADALVRQALGMTGPAPSAEELVLEQVVTEDRARSFGDAFIDQMAAEAVQNAARSARPRDAPIPDETLSTSIMGLSTSEIGELRDFASGRTGTGQRAAEGGRAPVTPPRFAEVSDIDRTFDPSQFDLPSDVRAILARPPAPAVETYASFRDDSVAGIPSLASTDASAVIEVNGHDIEVETTGVEQVEEAPAASADDGMSEGSRGLGKLGFADQLRGFEDDAANTFFPDEFEEAEFFIQQEILDEAREILQQIQEEFPDSPRVIHMLARIEAREQGAPEPKAPWEQKILDEVEEQLGDLQIPARAEAEQPHQVSVEEVLSQFKKGVAETVPEDDAATHYDLGIAYREMGLLEDAVGEFVLAARAPSKAADSRYLIGVTRLDQGRAEDALQAFDDAIKAPSATREQRAASEYQRGLCYEQLGRGPDALISFKRSKSHGGNAADLDKRLQALVARHGDLPIPDLPVQAERSARSKNIDYV